MSDADIPSQAREPLEARNGQLRERIKELTCLYELSRLCAGTDISESTLCHRTVQLIPPAWQYPEITCARLVWKGREYTTDQFQKTQWTQTTDLVLNTEPMGFLQVCYLQEMPPRDEGPFLQEERNLLDALARNVSFFLAAREKEEQKRHLEKINRAMVQSSPLPVFSLDMDGKVLTWNPAAEKVLGWTAAEVIGRPLPFVPEEKQEESAAIRRRIFTEGGFSGLEVVRRTKDGRLIDVSLSTAAISDHRGQPMGSVAFMEDITERKKAERAITENEERLRVTLQSIGDGVIATDTEGRVTRMNPVAEALTGWSLEQAASKPLDQVFSIVNARTGQKADNPVHKVLSTGKIVGLANHTKLLARDGHEYQIADSGAPIRDSAGNILGVVLVFRDVSHEYRMQQAVRENEARFRELFAHMNSGVAVYRAVDEGNDFEFLDLNTAGANIDNLRKEDVLGRRLSHVFPRVKEFGLLDVLRQVWRTGVPQHHPISEYTDQRITGWRENFVYRLPTGEVVAVYEDITQRKQTELALKSSESRYRRLFTSIRDAILVTDTNRKIIDCNPAFTELFGYTLEEIRGRQPGLLYADPDKDQEMAKQLSTSSSPRFICTLEYKTKEGLIFPGETNIFFLHKDAGEVVGRIGLIRDVSEREKNRAEKERLEMQLRQAQKMEAVGRLAGGVAHDFNNLLTTITGNAQIGLMDLTPDQELYSILQEIQEAGEKAGHLTRQLLAFSRKQILQPEVLDLNNLILELEKMLRRLIGEHITLETRLMPGLKPIKADPGQMEQAILNLVINARDAMPSGGRVTIETANPEPDQSASPDDALPHTAQSWVMLAISDTGQGMSPQTQSQIFDPFFTTKEKGQGTGLGLSTVYGVIQQSKGTIRVQSAPGQGTTFTIFLPVAQDPEPEANAGPAVSPDLHGRKVILVVEDEPSVREIVASSLRRFGYTVLTAGSGPEALELCKKRRKEIDLVLTDVVMPEMNGRELVESIQALGANIQVIYMSGYTENVVLGHEGLDTTVCFLQKPFSAQALAAKVREALRS